MKDVCKQKKCDFALLLGDNIYEDGVSSVDDIQFIDKFENPYKDLNFPFYSVLGNHDLKSGKTGELAQIEYTKKSKKWVMPSHYYKVSIGKADFFAIDSNRFSSDKCQKKWLKDQLEESNAIWKFVFGHHTPYTIGRHNLTDVFEGSKLDHLEKDINQMLCENAQAYFAGHDHHIQINRQDCGFISVVSGAAGKARMTYPFLKYGLDAEVLYSEGFTYGFMLVMVKNENISFSFYGMDNKLLYNYESELSSLKYSE